ncbi:hypothetical protein DW322_18720 [Rhodococcus rhodnii]|uniref:Uncharacterized protein n=2 Tax=Rhodococcus rhodnii TaxID=38312 RepID=R7WJZ1_9NOCA|nr:hypothetical protein [Rhodococcus rhodnii]EOM75641.1 hypothetical protein Rrhod_3101 [Rhodococcus rhodnii LMG 5362]TXG91842.1 hypothetical protein DW322_18720 [Rhodococcus rhodnii]
MTIAPPAPAPPTTEPAGADSGLGSTRSVATCGIVVATTVLLLNLLVAADIHDWIPLPLRAAIVVIGALAMPGLPVTAALRIPGFALATSVTISTSLAVTIVATQTAVVIEAWSPAVLQTLLAVAAIAVCAVLLGRAGNAPRPKRAPRHSLRVRAASLAALAVALVLFVVAARTLDTAAAHRFGIVTEIGPAYVAGLVVVAGVLVTTLRRTRIDHVVATASVAVLVTYSTLLVGVATGHTSVPTAFVHRGFVSTIAEAGFLPSGIDARFSWAGFFAASAHLVTTGGLPDTEALMTYAPLAFGMIMCAPVYAIALVVTRRARLAWVAVVVYQAFNWYQQDYFAPQAVAVVFYATIVAVLLWQLRSAPLPAIRPGFRGLVLDGPRRTPGLVPGWSSGRTLALGAVLLLVVLANTMSHQITPILTVIALAAFAACGVTRYRTLWIAAGLMFAAWFSYGATDYWLGHLHALFAEIGQVGTAVGRGVQDRLAGDPVYQQMQYLRMGASGVFGLVAFGGWVATGVRRTRGRAWLVAGVLCAAPFSMVALQSYGGEMIIRCFVLASPVLAPFVALALAYSARALRRAPAVRGFAAVRGLAAAVAIVGLVATMLVLTTNRGLNTAFEASTDEEVTVSGALVERAPGDATIMTWSHAPHTVGPRRLLEREPRVWFIDSYPCLDDLAGCAEDRWPSYILVTSQAIGMLELQYGMSREYLDASLAGVAEIGYVPMYESASVLVLRRADAPPLALDDPAPTGAR